MKKNKENFILPNPNTVDETSTQISEADIKLFFEAVRNGNYSEVSSIIESCKDAANLINEFDPRSGTEDTALHICAREGYDKIAELLLLNGANVDGNLDAQEQEQITPLQLAARNGNTSVAEKLILSGAAINHQDIHGRTALSEAVDSGNLEIKNLLVRAAETQNRNVQPEAIVERPKSPTLERQQQNMQNNGQQQ
jgi:ankyrin repeat protein